MKKIISLILVMSMLLSVCMTGCSKKETAKSLYQSAIESVLSAEGVSFDFSIIFGEGYGYDISVKQNGDEKELEFKNDNSGVKVYVTEGKHYYDLGEEGKYSVNSSEDSVIMQELIDFKFFANDSAVFDDDTFENVEITVRENGKKRVDFPVMGDVFKSGIAPDEDVYFSSVHVMAEFTGEGTLTEMYVLASIEGSEFYGMPIYGSDNVAIKYVLNGIGDEVKPGTVDTDNDEWQDCPARALITPASLAFSKQYSVDCKVEMEISMLGMSFKIPMEMYMASKEVEDKTLSVTKVKVDANILGQQMKSEESTYSDGNGDYTYHVTDDGNYKTPINKENDTSDFLFTFDDIELYKDAEITKAGQNTVIKITLTKELMDKISSAMNSAAGDAGAGMAGGEIAYDNSSVEIVIDSDGNISSATAVMKMTQKVDGGDSMFGQTMDMSVSLKFDMTFGSPTDDINIQLPEGYTDFPVQEESEE